MITQIGFDPWHYDADGDCYISAFELSGATADYQNGFITQLDLAAVVNLWNQHTKNPACGGRANLNGLVHDKDGTPLPEVIVSLHGVSTVTKVDGTFSFIGFAVGKYTITCMKSGYQDVSKSITLITGLNGVDITMLAKGEIPWYKKYWWALALSGGAAITGTILLIRKPKKAKVK